MSTAASNGRSEMIRRLRLGNLRKLLRHRCNYVLPDDDAGREYLHELLLPISVGPHADIKTPNAIEIWAPWMQQAEATQLIDRINITPIRRRMPTAKQLGERLRVTNSEREQLKLWTIRPYNMGKAELLLQNRAKAKARMRRLRQLQGRKSRTAWLANSLIRQKPWAALGISRATWYRQRETGPCALRLTKAANTPVSPQQAQPPEKRLSEGVLTPKLRIQTKAEKPKGQKAMPLTRQPPGEIREHTCLTSSANEPAPIGNGWWRNAKTPDEQL